MRKLFVSFCGAALLFGGLTTIRVFAADGLNTVSQDVANLTPSAATLTP